MNCTAGCRGGGDKVRSYETKRITRSGNVLDVWITLSLLTDDKNHSIGIATTERDITARVKNDLKMIFENRALKALNAWYDRFSERPLIPLEEVCQMLVEEAGYHMAWIGQVDDGKPNPITPMAWAGFPSNQSPTQAQVQSLADQSRQLIETALQNQQPLVIRNILNDPSLTAWSAEARKNGYNSFIVLPLLPKNDPRGVLFIYAANQEAFIKQEIERLVTLSERISQKLGPGWKDRLS